MSRAKLKNIQFGTTMVLSVGGKMPDPETGDVPVTSGAYPVNRVNVDPPADEQLPAEIRLQDKANNVIEFASAKGGVVDYLTTVALPDKNKDGSLRSFTVSVVVNSSIPGGEFALPFAGPRYGNACTWSAGRTVTTFAANTSYSFAYSEIEEDKWDVKCVSLSSNGAKWYENPVVFGRTAVTTQESPLKDGCAGFHGGVDQHGNDRVSVSFGLGGSQTNSRPTVLTGFSRLFGSGSQPSFPKAYREILKDSSDAYVRGSAVSTAALGDFNLGVQLFGKATAGGIRVMPITKDGGDQPTYEIHAYVPNDDGTSVEITPDAIEISADGTKVYMNAYQPSSLRNSIYEFDVANGLKSGQDTDLAFVKEHPIGTRVRGFRMFGNKLFAMAGDEAGEPARWWVEDLSNDSGFVCVADPMSNSSAAGYKADDIFIIDEYNRRHLYYCTSEMIYGFNLRADGLWHDGTMFMAPVSLKELGVCAGSSGNQFFVSKDETKMIFASNSSVAYNTESHADYPVVFGFVGSGKSATKMSWCDIQHPDTFPANKESIVSFLQERLSGLDDTATVSDVINALTSMVVRGK